MESATAPPRPDRRRRRPALACVNCRRSKIKCDRLQPCTNCSKSKNKTCVFDKLPHKHLPSTASEGPSSLRVSLSRHSGSPPEVIRHPRDSEQSSTVTISPVTSQSHDHDEASSALGAACHTPSSVASFMQVDALKQRVTELERRLAHTDKVRPQEPRDPQDRRAWTAHVPTLQEVKDITQMVAATDMHSMPRAIMSKTRYYGLSHWSNAVLLYKVILEMFTKSDFRAVDSEGVVLLSKCKALGRRLKSSRIPSQYSMTPRLDMPPRMIADQLVNNYLRISESVLRVLHVPTFRASYEKSWVDTRETVDHCFVIQSHLVMAIGATVFDSRCSMRSSAVRWVCEAQYWYSTATFKRRLTMMDLQNMILLCIARQMVGIDADLIWITSGWVLRIAIQMGYHRDPSRLPPTDRFNAELRRRLWSTILDLNVESSITSGSPPMLSLTDFDTEPPADVDDVYLQPGVGDSSTWKIDTTATKITDMTIALAFRATLGHRLAICHFLNDLGTSSAYDKTMELHESIATIYKNISRAATAAEAESNRKLSLYQRQTLDCTIRRYFLALHIPHQEMSLKEPAYAFSKSELVSNAIKIYSAYCPPAVYAKLKNNDNLDDDDADTDMSRLAITAFGNFRWVPVYTTILVGLDLQDHLKDEMSFTLLPPRPDVVNILETVRTWCLRRLKAGDTNCKGYLFTSAQWAMVNALVNEGKKQQDIPPLIRKAAIDSVHVSVAILEGHVRHLPPETEQSDAPWDPMQTVVSTEPSMMPMEEDWEGVGNFFLDFLNLEPIHPNFGFLAPPQTWM